MSDEFDDLWWDECEKVARIWLEEFDAGCIGPSDLRRQLARIMPGSLSRELASKLYWREILRFDAACHMCGISPTFARREVFGTQLVQATHCEDWFDTTNPRHLADPPELCPSHGGNPEYRKYMREDKWRHKSDDYKKRHPICEHCRRRPSTNVHHTDDGYQNLGRETDDDLEALCRVCHAAAHGLAVEIDGRSPA